MADSGRHHRGGADCRRHLHLCAGEVLWLQLTLTALLLAAPLHAQDPSADAEARARIARNESDIAALKDRLAELEREGADRKLRDQSIVNIYGDIGMAWHMMFESQTETFNRPEFRLHFGVFGTAFEQDGHRIRYDMRLTTVAEDVNGKPTPTLSWLPFPGFGVNPQLALDRFMLEYAKDEVLYLGAGRFPGPYVGAEMLFDQDYHFQGLTETLRLDRIFGESFQRNVPRLGLTFVQGYLAQNSIGLPQPPAATQPIYAGGQVNFEYAPFVRPGQSADGQEIVEDPAEFEFRLTLGLHWFDGEEGIAPNIGVGYLTRTTNVLGANGFVQSEFVVAEAYTELIMMRMRRARVKAWFHGLFNLGARPQIEGRGERNEFAFESGVSWGMERLFQRWDFRLSLRYYHIEADALMPEFNSEILNTNIKAWHMELQVRIFPTMTLFGTVTLSERENFELNGFGLPNKNNPNRASGQSFRAKIGLFLEF